MNFRKILYSVSAILAFAVSNKAFSQIIDNCSGTPNLLTVGTSCTTTNYTVAAAWTNDGPAMCTGTSYRDGWFRFTTGAGVTSVAIDGTSDRQMGLAVYTACGGTEVGCTVPGAANASLSITVTPSTTYYLRIARTNNANANTMVGTICVYSTAANDNCSGPTVLTPGASCSPTAGNTTTGYSSSGIGCNTGTPDDDIWYSFVATATSHSVTVDGASDFDAVVAVYTSCLASSSPTGGACADVTGADGIEALTLSGLTIGTTYYIKVHDYAAGGGNFTICITTPVVCSNPAAATLPYTENFETGSGGCPLVGVENGSQTNRWAWGTATANGGTRSMYISNTNGTTNNYTGTSSIVHFYRDIVFPASPTCYTLTFDHKGVGESTYDYMQVFLVSPSTTPVAGTALPSGQIGATYYNQQATWQTSTIQIPASNAGTTMRLVFSWTNDVFTTNNPPAAVDNISITASASTIPGCATLGIPANAATNLCATAVPLTWTAPASGPCNAHTGYKLYLGTNVGATNIINGMDIGNVTTYTLTSLNASTTYYWSIVPYNTAAGDATGCPIRSFTTAAFTPDNSAPITDNFSASCLDWITVNGTETNQWFLGSATGNPASSVYISNNNGTGNAYSTGVTSIVHFYKDIDFPAGQSCITLTFDWKNVGEATYDYINVYLAPTTENPVAGTLPTAAYQVGTSYDNQSGWQTVTLTLPASAAGTTQRLIFTWRNDGFAGTQPPGAIDNINIAVSAPPVPNCAGGFIPANAATNICPVSTALTWTAPTGTCQNVTGYLLYVGTDPAATNLINGTNVGNVLTYTLPTLSGSTLYYWKIVPVNGTGSAVSCTTNSFTTSASPSATACSSAMGAGVTAVTLPYTLASGTTVGMGDNLTAANTVTCGSTNYLTGTDVVYVFTPTASGAITASVTITGATADAGMMLYEGCPLSAGGCGTAAGSCIGYAQSNNGGTRTINACVQAGVTYYLVLDAYTTPVDYSFTNLSITAPTGAVVNDDPCTAIDLPIATTCSYATYSNQCATASSGVPAPGCANYQGGDVWFKVTVPSSGAVTIDTDDLVMLDGGMAAYSGSSCSSLTLLSCDDDNSANGTMPQLTLTSLTPGQVIYIRVWEAGNNNNGTFGICVSNPCPSGSPSNDVCTSATALTLGTTVTGNNSCSGNIGEPARPTCWTTGNMNTVWYSFVAPASGQIKIRTIAGTLTNTQIEVLSGACSSTMTSVGCNNNAVDCGGTSTNLSFLSLTGLTAGVTYYIRVDGANNLTGSFAVIAIDGTSSFPGSANQDCVEPGPVCNQQIAIGNPGYQSYGANCDLPTSYCLSSGERNVVWYRIPINAAGSLTFNIVPNDYTGTAGPETDYDFAIWRIDVGATCATIAAGTSTPLRCNYDPLGVTGLATGGNSPAPYTGFNLAYETPIAVANGEIYLLAISNYSNSTSGFQLDFNGSAPIDYSAAPTTVAWTGGTSTAYNITGNWGGCAFPTCGINAEVTPASTNQPNLTAAISPQRVKDLMINPGSTLTLGPNSVLEICGNFTNLGTLSCDPTSTVIFNGTGTQTVSGDLTGTNRFGHFTVTKSSGTVILASHMDVGGNFTTSSATSVFNINGYILNVAGNFTNSSAGTTFTGVANSTVIFNGTAAQTYTPGGALVLNNVTMNHSGTGVTITTTGTPNLIVGTAGLLTLTNGRIITPGNQQVEVRNTANASVGTGNTGSFVEGNLLRYLAAGASGSFNFPVGHATKGYQLANLNFTTAASGSASQLLARFDAWGGGFPQPGSPGWGPECAATYNQPFLDNGFWSVDVASGASTGTYNITLYNTNYTNAAAGFSVGKSPSGAPAWALQGTCVGLCPVTAVQRNGMTGFSKFATVQSSAVLPLQLLSFTAQPKGTYNEVKWETASEEKLHHFELQSSSSGLDFRNIHNREAAGNSSSQIVYRHNDYSYYSPVTYYRLRSVDNDGSARYSSIIQVENLKKMLNVWSIFPNPAMNEVNIHFEAPYDNEMTVEVKDILGRQVAAYPFNVTQGDQTISINTVDLSQGTYIVSCKFENLPAVNNRLIINK
jgi:hypothetical protein